MAVSQVSLRIQTPKDSLEETNNLITNGIIDLSVGSLTDGSDLMLQNGNITDVNSFTGNDVTVTAVTAAEGTIDTLDVNDQLNVGGSLEISENISLTGADSLLSITNPTGFRMGTNITNGYVLTTDSNGYASWEPPAGNVLEVGANPTVFYTELDQGTYNIGLIPSNQTPSFGGGQGVIYIGNSVVAPTSNPIDGGYLFVSNGELFYRGINGTVTNLASS